MFLSLLLLLFLFQFSDINGDGFDDLIIGSPLRTDDITEEIHAGEILEINCWTLSLVFEKMLHWKWKLHMLQRQEEPA